MKTIQEEWREYKTRCYPKGMGADQNKQVHQAFFAGAMIMFRMLNEASALPDAEAVELAAALEKELIQTGLAIVVSNPLPGARN